MIFQLDILFHLIALSYIPLIFSWNILHLLNFLLKYPIFEKFQYWASQLVAIVIIFMTFMINDKKS